MLKLLSARRSCQSGLNGLSPHGRETAFADTCERKSSNREQAKKRNSLLCKTFLSLLFVLSLLPDPSVASQINAFVYHRFNDSRYPSTNISLDKFRAHLQILQDEHFTVMSLGGALEALHHGDGLPDRCAVITVDDAYRSFLTDGWPLLKEFGYPATLFVNTDTVGAGDFLNWEELKKLRQEGVEIGNHSAAHAYMLDRLTGETEREWKVRVNTDLMRSRQAFTNHLGATPELFAYPYGEFSRQLSVLVEEAGFRAAFGQQSGVITAGQNVFTLPRFPVGGDYVSVEEFRSKLFMRHLSVSVDSPQDTVITGNKPPRLKLFINNKQLHDKSLRCYASAGLSCQVEKLRGNREYEVSADGPIAGRRGKYTLTATDVKGEHWYWFSQLWVLPRGAVADNSVP